MKQFDKIEEFKKDAICYKVGSRRYYVFGFEGSIDKWQDISSWKRRNETPFKSFADRKLESNRITTARILIYYDGGLEWKYIYRNSKGSYFKKNNRTIYINKRTLPKEMK